MEKNIKTYRTHRALSLLYGLASTIFIFFAFQIPEEKNPMIFGIILFLGLSAMHFWIATGAKNGQNWARVASQIIAVLMLPGFPIGTLIGVSLLANAWRPWEQREV
jgi:NO-binding membrane sensor protein with MHYT domain